MTKDEARMAYEAGLALPSMVMPDTVAEDKRHLGMHHCPFNEGTPEYVEYARGLHDALGGDRTDIPNLIKELHDVVKVASDVE